MTAIRESYSNCCQLASAAWWRQDVAMWVAHSNQAMCYHAMKYVGRSPELIHSIKQRSPTRQFLADWSRHCDAQGQSPGAAWYLCAFIHGSDEQGGIAEYMYQLWQKASQTPSSHDLVAKTVRCIQDPHLLRLPVFLGIQKLLQLDGTFSEDTLTSVDDQNEIKEILISAHHHFSIRAARDSVSHPALLLDWIFQQCPLRCDSQSYYWINQIAHTGLTYALTYLVNQTRGSDFQLWTALLRTFQPILASCTYCPELKPFRILGVYLYSLDRSIYHLVPDDSDPDKVWLTTKGSVTVADSEPVLVEYGPELSLQGMAMCPPLIQEAVNANRSLKKSARSQVCHP